YILSAAIFFIVERNNTLAGMPLSDQIVQSIFNAFSPRSSGFVSVNPARFMPVTIIVVMIMMWIGGASQSTAGGIKVNTFAVILLELKAVITGNNRVVVYNRTLAHDSIRRAFAVVTISILSYAVVSLLLIAFEPTLSTKALLFEAASALFTVGSSLGITDRLGLDAKLLLCLAMFVGRVGLLSLLTGMVRHTGKAPLRCPEDNVIIN
ncbi:MAG: potassium transporter, partial [Muribaculaceae bacterium]|nr:potassium transporter [Muribaculaceae bacterium]